MPIGSSLGITLPTVGGSTNTWGSDLNTELNKIITAVEAQVPAGAIDFSADFDFNNYALTNAKHLDFDQQTSVTALNSVYFKTDNNLYVRDGGNNEVQITVSGALNNASAGGLGDSGGTYGTSGITFDWDGTRYNAKDGSGANDYADVRMDDLILQDGSGNQITIACPSIGTNYTVTLPNAVAASAGLFLQSDASGNCSWSNSTAQDITLTGSAKLVHGQRERIISAVAGEAGGVGSMSPVNSFWQASAGSQRLTIPIPCEVNERIVSITFYYAGADTSTKTFEAKHIYYSSEAVTTLNSNTSTAAINTTLTLNAGSLPYTERRTTSASTPPPSPIWR